MRPTPTTTHGLPSDKTALITSDVGKLRSPEHHRLALDQPHLSRSRLLGRTFSKAVSLACVFARLCLQPLSIRPLLRAGMTPSMGEDFGADTALLPSPAPPPALFPSLATSASVSSVSFSPLFRSLTTSASVSSASFSRSQRNRP